MRYALSPPNRAQRAAIIEQIAALPRDNHDIASYGPLVVALFRDVSPVVWQSIDDDIGNAAPWTRGLPCWQVRSVRTPPEHGPRLFDALARN